MALPLLRCCSWLSNSCLLLSQTSVTKLISCQTSTNTYMLTHTANNKQEIQWIPFLTTSFVPPHYRSRIQTEEVTHAEWIPLRETSSSSSSSSSQLHVSCCKKLPFIMNLLQASPIMCLKSPSSWCFCFFLHFFLLLLLIFDCGSPLPLPAAVNKIWWFRGVVPLTSYQRGVENNAPLIPLQYSLSTCSCIIHGHI